MAQRNFRRYCDKPPMADMNVVPLVDVMLVLLVIFIVTAPLLTHAVKIDLPKATSSVNITKPEHIALALRENGELFFNGETVLPGALAQRFASAAARQPQPELHIRADRHVYYDQVAQVLALAAKAGLLRIGFVSEPHSTLEVSAAANSVAAPNDSAPASQHQQK